MINSYRLSRSLRAPTLHCRQYATHRDPSSLLANVSLDTKPRDTQSRPSHNSIGPFQLGTVQPTSRRTEPIKKFSELSTAGKLVRGTVNSTNFAVILVGGAFTALVTYSFFSETLSPNSPTVVYGDACDLISKSTAIKQALPGSLSFHNSQPTSARTRRRERTVENRISRDSRTGRERMTLHFYVQSTPKKDKAPLEGESWLDKAETWISLQRQVLADWDMQKGAAWVERLTNQARDAFRFLTGRAKEPSKSLPEMLDSERKQQQQQQQQQRDEYALRGWRGMFNLGGLFSGLTATNRLHDRANNTGKTWIEGEVHADLIMNDSGRFVFRSLRVDVPSTRNHDEIVWIIKPVGS